MKKLLSILLSAILLLTSVAALAEDMIPSPETEAVPATTRIDFADGNFAFFGMDMTAGNADASELSIVDYKGGKALRVDVKSKVPYVALNIEGLLGENYTKLAAVSFDVGAELGSDGKVAQITVEEIAAVLGEDVSTWGNRMQCESSSAWSVYAVSVGQAY